MNAAEFDGQSCSTIIENHLGTSALTIMGSILGLVTMALLVTVIVAINLGYRLFKHKKNTARYVTIAI